MIKPLVIIESPYAGNLFEHTHYARRALLHSIQSGEVPIASHLLYTQVLNDNKAGERELGMSLGFEWLRAAKYVAVYEDYGITKGMEKGIHLALGTPFVSIVYRKIGKNGELKTLYEGQNSSELNHMRQLQR